jgi:membrane associated rhomboid family serine protease
MDFLCPDDGRSLLHPLVVRGHEIYFCYRCHGAWYEGYQFGQVIKNSEQWRLVQHYPRIFLPSKIRGAIRWGVRTCPRDHRDLETFQYVGTSGIFLDRCSQCSGIWVDGGELIMIAERMKRDERWQGVADAFVKHMNDEHAQKEFLKSLPLAVLAPVIALPYGDDDSIAFLNSVVPVVTIALIATNAVVFFLVNYDVSENMLHSTFLQFGFIPSLWYQWYRFVTNLFLHRDFLHLFGNMLFLWVFGDNLERLLGWWRYLLLYLFFGVVANVAFLYAMGVSSPVPVIGASGAISGVLGAYLLLFRKNRIRIFIPRIGRIWRVGATGYLGGWIFWQLIFADLSGIGGGVAYSAHIGGFFAGALFGLIYKKFFVVQSLGSTKSS